MAADQTAAAGIVDQAGRNATSTSSNHERVVTAFAAAVAGALRIAAQIPAQIPAEEKHRA